MNSSSDLPLSQSQHLKSRRCRQLSTEGIPVDSVNHKDKRANIPTEELRDFIESNKHLPGIPSAAEVAENGIELASMNAKLLEKIEELTLYILQQQEQIDKQQEIMDLQLMNNDQQQKNNELMWKEITALKKQ